MNTLQRLVNDYLKYFPDEVPDLQLLQSQLRANENLRNRRNFHGHVTGSAIILSPDKKKVLLIHHKLFQLWQQPGGHVERNELPLAAAKREAKEETNIHIKEQIVFVPKQPELPLDIDTHKVPPRPAKNEPAHWHHDVRYLFIAADEKITADEEVNDAKWFKLDGPGTERIAMCIEKLRTLGIV